MKHRKQIKIAGARPFLLAAAAITLALAGPVNLAWAAKPPKPPPPTPPASYTYLYLGGLGGTDGNALAINNAGQVVGQSKDAEGVQHAFIVVPHTDANGKPDLWNPTGTPQGLNPLMIDLGLPVGVDSASQNYALDVNDLGQVIGHCWAPDGIVGSWVIEPVRSSVNGQPTTWYQGENNGPNSLMIPLRLGQENGDSAAINNLGVIVSTRSGAGFVLVPKDVDGRPEWFDDANSDGVNDLPVDLGPALGLNGSLVELQPRDINDAGWVVGYVPFYAGANRGTPFLLTPATGADGLVWFKDESPSDGANDLVVRLPLPQADLHGLATVVNNRGTIAGQFRTSQGPYHAILWKADAQGVWQYTDLGVPKIEDYIESRGINESDQVVGRAILYGAQARIRSYSGWLWQNGVMTDARTLMDKSAELAGLWMATAGINNAGVMVGWTGGPAYPWIAVPIP